MRKAVRLLALFLLLACGLGAQEIFFERYPSGVDFWVMIPYQVLNFKQGEDTAQYQLSLSLKNAQGRQAANFERQLSVPRRAWLAETALPYLFQADLPPGKYMADFRLRNLTLGDKRRLEKSFSIGESYTEIGQPYLILAQDGVDYIPAGLKEFPLEAITFRQKFTEAADSLHIRLDSLSVSIVAPVGEIAADLTAVVNQARPRQVSIRFFAGNIRYDMEPFWYSQWFSYNLTFSHKDQMEQLRYIASQNEWRSLRGVPKDNFADAIDRFWQVHDPSPGTVRNEARESFYQRVIQADERYTIHKRLRGWRSDRGRIYIKYGEPDDIQSEVHPIEEYPYIIWTYYQEKLEFVFADTGGYGQYTLRNKDEEFSDN